VHQIEAVFNTASASVHGWSTRRSCNGVQCVTMQCGCCAECLVAADRPLPAVMVGRGGAYRLGMVWLAVGSRFAPRCCDRTAMQWQQSMRFCLMCISYTRCRATLPAVEVCVQWLALPAVGCYYSSCSSSLVDSWWAALHTYAAACWAQLQPGWMRVVPAGHLRQSGGI
jgi:hypothetical protein